MPMFTCRFRLLPTVCKLALVPILLNTTLADAQQKAVPHSTESVRKSGVLLSYGTLQLAFEANGGRIDPSVRFLAHGDGYSLFLTNSEAVLALKSASACEPANSAQPAGPRSCAPISSPSTDVIRMRLSGASSSRHATGENELPGKVNYFFGNDPSKWHTHLPTYSRVRFADVYPGIDLVYYGNQRQLEYDFVVAPNRSPSAIRLSFTGERDLRIAENGDLTLKSANGQAVFHKPIIYQNQNGHRRAVEGGFLFLARDTIGFSIGSYDHTRPLIIDPVLIYSTYLGGSGLSDVGNGISVDSSGSAYVVGWTYSLDFPVSDGAIQSQNNSTAAGAGPTVFVTKLNAAGTAIIYSTYLGGSNGEIGYGIAVDSSGAAYVAGVTNSSDFPVTCGGFQLTNHAASGGSSGFIAKLNPAGDALVYSTYLGGSGPAPGWGHGDKAAAIAVDSSGSAYVTGTTPSNDFPVTEGAFQAQNNGYPKTNAFVAKLNPNGTALVYSTLIGGRGATGNGDVGNAIALDSSNNVYIGGTTGSPDFPVTSGSLQTSFGASTNAFVTKLNPTGTAEVYSTFLGNGGGASANAIAVDSSGSAYVAGTAGSPNFPVTDATVEGGNFGSLYSNWPTGFVSKLSADGSSLIYSTYLQGIGTVATGLAVDSAGIAYVAGTSSSQGAGYFGGFQSTVDSLPVPGYSGAFVVKLNSTATALNYATLLGGTAYPGDGGSALALDGSGNVYLTGLARTKDFPTTTGALQTSNNASSGGANAFITKFALSGEVNSTTYPAPATNIPTEMDGVDITWYQGSGLGPSYLLSGFAYSVLDLYGTSPGGPALTGTLTYTGPDSYSSCTVQLTSANESTECDGSTSDALYPGTYTVTASYSGDDYYLPSTATGQINWPLYTDSNRFHAGLKPKHKSGKPDVGNLQKSPTGPGGVLSLTEKRFVDPLSGWGQANTATNTSAILGTAAQGSVGCVSPGLTFLTVKVNPATLSRAYGAANPTFTYAVTGLLNGDTVNVSLQTAATNTSPVGTYPVNGVVSGAAVANYNLRVESAALDVTPAPLTVTAKNASVKYGEPLQPLTGYLLSGFVNGDKADIVSGTPVLSSTVELTTPVGVYPIQVNAGTLKAANYKFIPTGTAGGSVHVNPAALSIEPTNESMRYGQAPPHLSAYKLKGFVNGDTSRVVSGSPVLSTKATSASPPGTYQIQTKPGTLKAHNYIFEAAPAVLIVNKAILTLKAKNLTMREGATPPKLAYTLDGLVNHDSARVVSGAPALSTTATAKSKPGKYPIIVELGTLKAQNYRFVLIPGVLTVTK